MITPMWVLLCQTEVRPIISNSHDVAAIMTHSLLPSAHAERHHPIFKASFLSGPKLLFPAVSITWLPYSQLVNSHV